MVNEWGNDLISIKSEVAVIESKYKKKVLFSSAYLGNLNSHLMKQEKLLKHKYS